MQQQLGLKHVIAPPPPFPLCDKLLPPLPSPYQLERPAAEQMEIQTSSVADQSKYMNA